MNITSGSVRLFRLFDIDVYLHWSWLLVAFIQISGRPEDYETPYWKVIEYVSLFAIVLMHEFGHALACRSVGGNADTIVLWPLGGIAYVRPPQRPGAVLWSIAAGPLVNAVLIIPTVAATVISYSAGYRESFPDLHRYLWMMMIINLCLLGFNLMPVYPLDGGQITQALLWYAVGKWRSLMVVSLIGLVMCGLLFLLAALLALAEPGSLILVFLALFMGFRSWVSFQQSRVVLQMLALPRHTNAGCPSCKMGPPQGQFWHCEECQTRFDLFDQQGKCPGCGAWYLNPACPHCGRKNHIEQWFKQVPIQGDEPQYPIDVEEEDEEPRHDDPHH